MTSDHHFKYLSILTSHAFQINQWQFSAITKAGSNGADCGGVTEESIRQRAHICEFGWS